MAARISRRQALVAGGGAAAAVVGVPFGLGLRSGGEASSATLLRSGRPLPAAFQVPLEIPRVLTPNRGSVPGADHYELTQRQAEVEVLPGVRTAIWGYDGTFPGSTIHARSGRPVVVRHTNLLPVPTVTHLHAGQTPSASDGFPTDLLLPSPSTAARNSMAASMSMDGMGGNDPHASVVQTSRDYTYPLQQRAAMLWYHDHRMDFTAPSVWRGLAGMFIVHDAEEEALELPAGERDIPLMIADRSFGGDGELIYPSSYPSLIRPGVRAAYAAGVLGDVALVNGRPWPFLEVDAARYRFRILNASNARRYRLTLDPRLGQAPFIQVGTDGGLLDAPLGHAAIEIAPAQRYDVVVDFSACRPGERITLRNGFGTGRMEQVMQFRIARKAHDDSRVPIRLSHPPVPDPARSARTRSFVFRRSGGHGWTINGETFSPTEALISPRAGSTEIWEFVSDFHHPIHVHLASMRVLNRGLNGPGEFDHGLKDVLDLRPAERIRVAITFGEYPGRYVLHCHNLEHEDMGMMATFRLV